MITLRKPNVWVAAALIALTLSGLTYALALSLSWIQVGEFSTMEIFAGTLNYAATFLCIKQRRNYALVGIVGSASWSYVYFSNDLLASGTVNLYLALMLVYGWWRWGKDTNSRKVHNLGLKWVPVYLVVTALIYGGAVWITSALGGRFAPLDAGILVLTILAQLLQDQKVIQAWFVWTAVNVIGVIIYWRSGLYFAFIQQAIFGLANYWGWVDWHRSMKPEETHQAIVTQKEAETPTETKVAA